MGCDVVDTETGEVIFAISIHAPIVGCDRKSFYKAKRCRGISIHAPIVGCDIDFVPIGDGYKKDFNPRTHRGVRR